MAGSNQTEVEGIVAQALFGAFAPEGYYLEIGCVGIIIYEYMLTFEMERRVIWGRRLTLPGALFYLNRYLLLAFATSIYLWGFVTWRSDSYADEEPGRGLLETIFGILLEACYAAFSALRVHAINDKKWVWTILVMLTGSVPIPINIVATVLASSGAAPPPLLGCVQLGGEAFGLQISWWKAGV
ncbi:hypothetical protein C8Q73DRAFT_795048 [Cubamyces lactineus]|nr:hypothetical protein C8Q73DRAFT_795048 [Cubamyces lactineus]